MKSTTTCPTCQTQFLVTDAQLSQYNGKVRCGHCLNVFSAVDYISAPVTPPEEILTNNDVEITLLDTSSDAIDDAKAANDNKASENASLAIQAEAPIKAIEAQKITDEIINDVPPFEANNIVAKSVNETLVAQNNNAETREIAQAEETIIANSPALNNENAIEPVISAEVLKEIYAQAELPLEETPASFSASLHSSSFHDSHQNQAAMHAENDQDDVNIDVSNINAFDYKPEYQYYLDQKKTTSPLLITLAVVFAILALLQCLFYYRHAIAMQLPESKPYLESVCQTLGCKINLPKEIQLFSIDDSTIAEDIDHQGVIHLSSTITNRAGFMQAYPNLEVTLTDTQDKPTLRRLFKPSEYLSKEQRLEEGIAAGDSIEVDMPLMSDDLKPAGFRLLVRY